MCIACFGSSIKSWQYPVKLPIEAEPLGITGNNWATGFRKYRRRVNYAHAAVSNKFGSCLKSIENL